MNAEAAVYQHPVEILQHLIRFNTTNPPGNEADCMQYINGLLAAVGIEATMLALDDDRPNLIARLQGRSASPPLLLYGHVDVVTTAGQTWAHPPFAGEIHDGYIWGRGALDMKSGVAMMLSAFLKATAEETDLPGDVIFCVMSDEENLGTYGAKFLVEQHAEQFEGVQHAIGEFGGFSMYIAGQRFYPIMVAEKQACWMKATVRGEGGHGSTPVRRGAAARLADLLQKLDRQRLPLHVTPSVRMMFTAVADALDFPQNTLLQLLLNPVFSPVIIKLLGEQGRLFDALLHNTVSPTVIEGSHKTNVIPSEITVELDGRLLPGFTPEDMFRELRGIIGNVVELEITSYDPGPGSLDMRYFDTLAAILREADPTGTSIPLLLPGVTDGRFFAQLGIQTYGFTPMTLPPDFNFSRTIHAADERIPVEAMAFGADAVYEALRRYRV